MDILKPRTLLFVIPIALLALAAVETALGQELVNPGFDDGLNGWTVSENGADVLPGSVSVVAGRAEILEGDSFIVTLQQGFTTADIPDKLLFDFIASPGFDVTAQFIPDAFEASLLYQNSAPAVPGWKPGATSFFNVQENGMVHLGAGSSFDGTTVTVDISTVPPQSDVTLIFDFIGGDGDTSGGVQIDGIIVQNIPPIDECTLGDHNCSVHAACTDIPIGFLCACNPGYTGDGVTCIADNVPPVATAGGPYTLDEGSSVVLDGTGSDDPDGDPISYEWDFSFDGTTFVPDVWGSATPVFSAAELDGPDNITVAVRVTDDKDAVDIATSTVTINNVAPVVSEISSWVEPVQVGAEITASAHFTDAGIPDTHTATWDWGDGSTAGTVTQGAGGGSVQDTHTYNDPGIYTVELTVLDDDGGAGRSIFQHIVVYDPDDSFVTGGGTIDSPAGAYYLDPLLTGSVNFGFVSKYNKGKAVPTGHPEFQFHAAGFDFKSSTYEWLVIAGNRAQFRGTGTIRGMAGVYGFMLTAIDAQLSGNDGNDKFRIRIWDINDDASVIFDNELGAVPEHADTTTLIKSGSIVIHKRGKK
jgi:PKD repeat protein